MEIVLSTMNPSKIEQIQAMFLGSDIKILSLKNFDLLSSGPETGTTLEENALKKANYARYYSGRVCVADDTGIFIDAIGGAPGVYTADWLGGKMDAVVKMGVILKELENIDNRSATFSTVVAVVDGSEKVDRKGVTRQHLFVGEIRGTLLREPRCKPQEQMPWSAIFLPDGSNKVFAEMTVDEENAISHRGQAFRKARAFLEQLARDIEFEKKNRLR